MKLVTFADGSRDGHLAVVDASLAAAHHAPIGATRLQQVLDDWNFLSPQLQDLAATLDGGKPRHALPFDAHACLAPLPRSHRCVVVGPRADGRLTAVDVAGWFGPPRVRLAVPAAGATLHWAPHLAVLTGDLPAGADPGRAGDAVRLVALAVRLALGTAAPADGGGDGDGSASGERDSGAPAVAADAPDGAADIERTLDAPLASGRWWFAPAALTADEFSSASARALQWRVDGAAATRGRRPPPAVAWPHPAGPVIASALTAAAAEAPLPAGSVVLWPLSMPVALQGARLAAAGRLVLRAVAADGAEPFGPIACDGLGDGPGDPAAGAR
jgi:hypothetical protein